MQNSPPNVPTPDTTSGTRTFPPSPPDPITEGAAGLCPAAPPGYELREEIGRGGMGVVYRARDLAFNREVAVKLLADRYGPDSAEARRFLAEARITGQLQHPGIPAVHQTGTTADGRPFLAMKLIKGRTLADLLRDRPDPSADRSRFLAIFEHVCHAVGYAHAHAVIHRDLKPSNVMVGAFDEVQVMDWGLAKVVTQPAVGEPAPSEDADAELTRTAIRPREGAVMDTQAGSLLGTPAFMSPEQAGGEVDKIGPRSDVFGLGAILCVILTGDPPYKGPGAEAIRLQAIRGQRDEAFTRLDGCGAEPELVALARRCLADLPQRPADAAEVANAVAGLRAAADERARRAERERAAAEVRVAEQRKRRRVWYALAGALLLGVAVSVVLAVRALQAEDEALAQRDLKEKAREEAVANETRARTAEAARRRELGRTAAAAADVAAGRGRWQEALRLYDTALHFGGGEEIALKLGRYDCRLALGQLREAINELDDLAARPRLGRFAGPILLRKAECALWRQAGGDPRALARQAIASKLPPADAAYARVFLARTAPEAIEGLQEAARLDPFHARGLDALAVLLFITGRRDEFREAVTHLRLTRPNSANHLFCEIFLHSLEGDRTAARRAIARLKQTGYAELVPFSRVFSDLIVLAQDEEFLSGGGPAAQMMSLATEYARMAQRLSQMAGEKNAGQVKLSNMKFFRLPMFQALADTPPFKGLSNSGPLGALMAVYQPGKMADVFGAIAHALPDGTFLMMHGMYLMYAGRLAEAEAAFQRALHHPSWANHRRATQLHLVQVQWLLASNAQTPPKERPVWKARARAGLRDLVFAGNKPLPMTHLPFLLHVAAACGDHALGLVMTESALRRQPHDPILLAWKLHLDPAGGNRIETTTQLRAALAKTHDRLRPEDWRTLLDFADACLDAGRLADARRWCDLVRESLPPASTDDPNLLGTWNRLGVSFWRLRQFDQSIPIFERLWAVRQKSLGPRDPETLVTRINLAVNYRDAGRPKEAIRLLEQVQRERPGDAALRWARGELVSAYAHAGMSEEGVALAKVVVAEARTVFPADSAARANALAQCGLALLQLKAWGQAEPVLREALAIREKAQPKAWTTNNARSLLGEALAGQKKYAEAERLLVQGFEKLKKGKDQIPETFRAVRLTEAADRLIRFYETLQKKDEATRWRKERDALAKP
jgi:tetratricopeptide (TPR) repeat protein